MPHLMNLPAAPGEGPAELPTPALPDATPAQPGEGPEGTPTPTLPDGTPAQPGEGPEGTPTPSLPSRPSVPSQPVLRCPTGYQAGTVLDGQTYGDLLVQNNVSYNAMRSTNPTLSPTRPVAGTPYCAPPSGSRRLCSIGARSYIVEQGENLGTIARSTGVSADRLLMANPDLAPSDFIPGRVICIP